jgi:16S rRNA G966 N2-methylase RsmD
LAVAIIRRFKATRMLDISAGWGDRLSAAIATNLAKYQAFDPNTSLKEGHDRIINAFVPVEQRRCFNITYTGFEHAQLKADEFDLVFTSPPFFDFEIYTALPGQSVDTYKSLDAWLVR